MYHAVSGNAIEEKDGEINKQDTHYHPPNLLVVHASYLQIFAVAPYNGCNKTHSKYCSKNEVACGDVFHEWQINNKLNQRMVSAV